MIKLHRPQDSIPAGLIDAGLRERRANHIAKKANGELTFSAYSSKKVKRKLAELFGRKCVFCESLLAGNQPGDVEHYRPKGKVQLHNPPQGAAKTTEGYYWLAAKWQNLLLSCADCNRPREQTDYDHVDRVIGKSNYFPLVDETKRARGPRGLSEEEPLLLNPCSDDPELHLVFHEDGSVEPVVMNGQDSPQGAASIYFLGLGRLELLQMRARHGRFVRMAIQLTLEALEQDRDPSRNLADLLAFLDPKEEYVAYTRMLVRKYMSEYLEKLGLQLE